MPPDLYILSHTELFHVYRMTFFLPQVDNKECAKNELNLFVACDGMRKFIYLRIWSIKA